MRRRKSNGAVRRGQCWKGRVLTGCLQSAGRLTLYKPEPGVRFGSSWSKNLGPHRLGELRVLHRRIDQNLFEARAYPGMAGSILQVGLQPCHTYTEQGRVRDLPEVGGAVITRSPGHAGWSTPNRWAAASAANGSDGLWQRLLKPVGKGHALPTVQHPRLPTEIVFVR